MVRKGGESFTSERSLCLGGFRVCTRQVFDHVAHDVDNNDFTLIIVKLLVKNLTSE